MCYAVRMAEELTHPDRTGISPHSRGRGHSRGCGRVPGRVDEGFRGRRPPRIDDRGRPCLASALQEKYNERPNMRGGCPCHA